MNFTILDEQHITTAFDCGNEDVNHFLVDYAFLYQKRHFGVTIDSLPGISTHRADLPYNPNPIPGFRICRLAIDKKFQGKGFGKLLSNDERKPSTLVLG